MMHAGKKKWSGEPAQPTSPPAKAAALSGSTVSLGALSKGCERPLAGMLPEAEESISGAQGAVVFSAYGLVTYLFFIEAGTPRLCIQFHQSKNSLPATNVIVDQSEKYCKYSQNSPFFKKKNKLNMIQFNTFGSQFRTLILYTTVHHKNETV